MYEVLVVCLFVLMTGACIGSFLNVVALRALSKESIVFPSSKCPVCNEPIKWYDNIPILSYLFTFKGKCRNCGCKVSIQYPIVEAITSILFLAVFIAFGPTLQTILLLILLSIAMVITITDLKKEYVYDVHMWIFIAFSILYAVLFKYGIENAFQVCVGLLGGVLIMEAIARLSYYLVRKDDNTSEDSVETKEENSTEEVKSEAIEVDAVEEIKAEETAVSVEKPEEKAEDETISKEDEEEQEEDIDINEYIKKHKRAFGEGDTYLAAGVGALLGWKYFIVAIASAIIIQALCILPQFFVGLYKQKEYRLLTSLSLFIILAFAYWVLSNIFNMSLYVVLAMVIALIFFAVDSITRLKKTVNEQGFVAIPFGPALLISAFVVLFWGVQIVSFLKKYIFMIFG